jgi:RNA recognition motif-containing protein
LFVFNIADPINIFTKFYSPASYQDNPSEKDINQGTLVVFNLDASVSNDDLRLIFGAYGEVKEVCIRMVYLIYLLLV